MLIWEYYMDVNEYQARAADTAQFEKGTNEAISISLLGLSGEVGELLTEYKKRMRDGDSYKVFKEKIIEEVGDILWYLSSIATYEGIELSEVMNKNLQKTTERWEDLQLHGQLDFDGEFFDDGCAEHEKLPREFIAEFDEFIADDDKKYVRIRVNDKNYGDPLRDNFYSDDYYRFHDIFHFSYVVVLGWSPIVRRFLECKRKDDDKIDEVEDGGRASVIDEAISALVFEYAKHHNYFEGAGGVDYDLLRTIKELTNHLEVGSCTTKQWEQAIILGFDIWRKLRDKKKGRVVCNMYDKSMLFEKM